MSNLILLEGHWQAASSVRNFQSQNPASGVTLTGEFPVSSWKDCDRALTAAARAAEELRNISGDVLPDFLEAYANAIEARAAEVVAAAHEETALAPEPRLKNIELPRTTTQLRQAAAAAREGSWKQAVIDTKLNIRSCFAPVGPVVVFGPNNFPLAFNAISGGDFAAAIAAGCPVIAKGHPLQPRTTELLARCAAEALATTSLPAATVQMLYDVAPEDGLRMVADARVGASCFTGSRSAGLRLKAAADQAGKPMYLEMSSLNPIVLLPGAVTERGEALATEVADSGLAASGQFCTSPNLLFVVAGAASERLIEATAALYRQRTPGPLLSVAGRDDLHSAVGTLVASGASLLTGGEPAAEASGFCYRNTVLRVRGTDFLARTRELQTEAFGNATMFVVCASAEELHHALEALEGNLTASIYSAAEGGDDALYEQIEPVVRRRCGRLLNDKMPTGVALSPAMNHGGPFPSTGHPAFTAVGIPRSMARFGALECYDAVRPERLPPALRDEAPNAAMWRMIDGAWRRN